MMGILLIALAIGNYRLNNELKDNARVIADQKLGIVNCEVRNSVLENANKEAIELAEKDVLIVEKKVVEIQKVYVPQIKYIDRYVGAKDETDCESSTKLITSFVY